MEATSGSTSRRSLFSILPPSSTFAPNNNAGRYTAWSTALDASPQWREATAYPHPEFDNDSFFLHDAGVLVLNVGVSMAEYGELPGLGLLDTFAKDRTQRFTAVGYGLEDSGPKTSLGGDTRRKADLMLIGVQGVFGLPDGSPRSSPPTRASRTRVVRASASPEGVTSS